MRDTEKVPVNGTDTWQLAETLLIVQCEEAMAPTEEFERMRAYRNTAKCRRCPRCHFQTAHALPPHDRSQIFRGKLGSKMAAAVVRGIGKKGVHATDCKPP